MVWGYRESLGVEVGSSRGEVERLLVSVCTLYVKSPAVGVSVRCFDLNCYSKFGTVVLGRRKYLGLSYIQLDRFLFCRSLSCSYLVQFNFRGCFPPNL